MKSSLYYIINIFFIGIALLFIDYLGIFDITLTLLSLVMLVLLVLITHILKLLKIYFIFLEEKIPIRRVLEIYLKTTFVTILLPYKTGEIFKAYSYGNEINNYVKGIIGVIIDKFFDALILSITLILSTFIFKSGISILGFILLAFIFIFLLLYILFPSTYYYLNKFFINSSQDKKNLFVLKVLDKSNQVYLKFKEMIRGRTLILVLITSFYWTVEYIYIFFAAKVLGLSNNFNNVINYLNDSFLGVKNTIFNTYTYLCIFLIIIIFAIIFVKRLFDNKGDE